MRRVLWLSLFAAGCGETKPPTKQVELTIPPIPPAGRTVDAGAKGQPPSTQSGAVKPGQVPLKKAEPKPAKK